MGNTLDVLKSTKIKFTTVELLSGDITQYAGDAIVFSANSDLSYDPNVPGIMGTMVRTAGVGPFEQAEATAKRIADKKGYPCIPGLPYRPLLLPYNGVVTGGGNLKAKCIMHIIAKDFKGNRSPPNDIYMAGDGSYIDTIAISKSVTSALEMADENRFASIAFPAMGTGLYRMPASQSAVNMLKAIGSYLGNETKINRISIVLYKPESNLVKIIESDSSFVRHT